MTTNASPNPIVGLAVVLLLSLLANAGLAAWILLRRGGRGNMLFIWTGRGLLAKPIKQGQQRLVWKRPDKTQVAFPLLPEYQMGYGPRGSCWIGNGATGQLLRWDSDEKVWVTMDPSATPEPKRSWRFWETFNAEEQANVPGGALMRIEFEPKPLWPDGNKFAEVLDDERERKWFQAQREADKSTGQIKPLWILIGIGAAIWFFSHGGIH